MSQTAAQKEWYRRNKERLAMANQEQRRRVLDLYGGRCECCGEDDFRFLTIGHVNRDGAQDRRDKRARGNSFYRVLLQEPRRDDLRVECWNCNMAHGLYGSCPHDQMLEASA